MRFSWKWVSVVLAVCLGVSLFVSVEVFALGSAGDIILDDESWFNGNVTVTGVGTFGSVVSGQGLYPLVTIYNGSCPRIIPFVFLGAPELGSYRVHYKPYFPENDTYGSAVQFAGYLNTLDYVSVFGDKCFVCGKASDNSSWGMSCYLNGTVFSTWAQLYP